ncbi:chromatin-modulating protein MRC1 [Pneumocystis jirovecii RU7]|uniref:DNA replication checkpoint mediator MRC1 domain-containing protein n=1 Tax=Pneumocystis jirovecii (strain RU7) TaxID=1408657 RepID=A0A0W4ZK35_PNEJ7|nr:chromatin-modulating protein MRC1 [Pneumocystis jirovecii RU7]KTW28719.1 hypothetical protein T551_02569 [Pneumocystis jirovecii RU7]
MRSLRKTYGRLQILDETESINSIKQTENEMFSSLSTSVSLTSSPTIYSNSELTPRSKVKATLARFDIDEFELYDDSKHSSLLLDGAAQFFNNKKSSGSVKDCNTYLNEDLSPEIISKDSAYERVKKMLIRQTVNKDNECHFNTKHDILKLREKDNLLNKGLFNVLDTSLSSDSSEKLIFGSGLKEKSSLVQSGQKKHTYLETQKSETSGDALDHNFSLKKDCSLIKKKKRAITKKVMEEMQKETERMDRGMALVPERRLDKKTSILNFLKKVGYRADSVFESSLDQQGSEKESETTLIASELDISFTDNNHSQNNDYSLNISSKDQMSLSLDFEIPNIISKFPKAAKPCLISKQIEVVNYQNHKKMSFKTLVFENSSDSELEIDSLFYNSKNSEKEFKSFMSCGETHVSYFDLARLGSPSQKSRIKNKLFDHELLVKAAEQVKSERLEREDELKRKGIVLTSFEERAKEVVEVDDLVEKERLKAEDVRNIDNDNDDDDDNIWNNVCVAQNAKKSNDEFFNIDNHNGDIIHDDNNVNINVDLDFSGHSDLKDIENVKIYDADQNDQSDLLSSEESEGAQYVLDEMEEATIRTKICRNNARRVIMDDENEYNDFCNSRPLQDSVDNIFNLSQFFSSTLPNKHIANDFLENNIIDEKIVNETLNVDDLSKEMSFKLSQANVNLNLETLDNMNDSNCKLVSFSGNRNFDNVEKEFENTQLSMFDPPSSDIVFDNFSVSPRYLHSNTIEVGLNVDVNLPSNILVGDFKRKKRLIQRVSSNNNYSDIVNNDENVFSSATNSKCNFESNNYKHLASKPEEFIEDQAQESDDEYAGLGGTSDDDDLDDVKELEDMIDNTVSFQDIDASDIAAYYMKKEIDNDMKIISNLYNDITTGNLKKRRNVMLFDLDDSDDDESFQRRNKRQQIIRQKLLDNQNLSFMADNPKMKAFLSTIEDNQENLQSFVDVIDDESLKSQKSNDDIKNLIFPDAVLNVDNIVENVLPESRILYSKKYADIKKELSFFVDQQDTKTFADVLIDNDVKKRFDNFTGVIDRVADKCVSKELFCFPFSVFSKGKFANSLFKRSLFGKDHLSNNDDCFIEKKKNVLGEIFKTSSINFASKLASRAVNYNRSVIAKNLKVTDSKILNKKAVNEKRKSNVLKLFQANTIIA